MPIRRVRTEEDGTEVEFLPMVFDPNGDRHFRALVKVHSVEELRRLHHEGRLVALRMRGHPPGKDVQRSVISVDQIEGL